VPRPEPCAGQTEEITELPHVAAVAVHDRDALDAHARRCGEAERERIVDPGIRVDDHGLPCPRRLGRK